MAMTPKEMIAVLQHFEAGGEVECRDVRKTKWRSVGAPMWNFIEFDYRPKPKPLECWMNVHGNVVDSTLYTSIQAAEVHRLAGGRTVHMREVVDEDS